MKYDCIFQQVSFYWNWIFLTPNLFSSPEAAFYLYHPLIWSLSYLFKCYCLDLNWSLLFNFRVSICCNTEWIFTPVALRTFIGNIMLHLMEILLMKRFTKKNKLIFGNNQWYHAMHFPLSFTFHSLSYCALASWFSSWRKSTVIYFKRTRMAAYWS